MLAERGLTATVWETQLLKLQQVQELHLADWKKITAVACSLGLAMLSRRVRGAKYHQALLAWQQEFNQDFLEGLGMHCKTQSQVHSYSASVDACNHNTSGLDGETEMVTSHVRSSWLAIATTPETIEALKGQPHLHVSGIEHRKPKAGFVV